MDIWAQSKEPLGNSEKSFGLELVPSWLYDITLWHLSWASYFLLLTLFLSSIKQNGCTMWSKIPGCHPGLSEPQSLCQSGGRTCPDCSRVYESQSVHVAGTQRSLCQCCYSWNDSKPISKFSWVIIKVFVQFGFQKWQHSESNML